VEHHAATASASLWDLLFPTINFALFVGLLVWQARPQVRAMFVDRAKALREQLAAGTAARARAAALRAELEREIADLPALRTRLTQEMRARADDEIRRLLEAARASAERIRTETALLGEQELRAARDALRAEVAAEATRRAGELIKGALQPDDQRRFLDEFVQSAGDAR